MPGTYAETMPQVACNVINRLRSRPTLTDDKLRHNGQIGAIKTAWCLIHSMSTVSKRPHPDTTANLPSISTGKPNYDIELVSEHMAQSVDKQQKLTAADWRAVSHILVNRAKKYALSFTKSDAANMHHIIQSAGIAHDKAYKGADGDQRGPAHVLIQLFGASDVGVKMARNLQRMIPQQRTITVTPIEGSEPPTPQKS